MVGSRPSSLALVATLVAACGGTTVNQPSYDSGAPDVVASDAGDANALPDTGPPPPAPAQKLDILFMIDNSASMGEKQEFLRGAVPDLLSRLVKPLCVSATDPTQILGVSQGGTCAQGVLEFKPVHDMHIGVVTSSLGGRGSDSCPADAKNPANPALNSHNDDQGHMINRAGADEHVLSDAAPSSFLAWFPAVPENAGQPSPAVRAIGDSNTLMVDFQDLVGGVHEYGCGFEAQLESWYRFLIQPDPYAQITVDPVNAARRVLSGVDATILQQRRDFLRPDSAVAVIVITDENEEAVDPQALGGQGWAFMNSTFPGSTTGAAPKGTQVCAANPNDPGCTTCAFAPSDPGCNPAFYDAANDNLNVRGFHMKQRFGVDPRFPVSRYVRALTQAIVPDRAHEHTGGNANYTGDQAANCTNPLFALSLPTDPAADLCNLARSTRTPQQVFFLLVGGVPHQLLQTNPLDPNSPQKAALTADDWTKILGADPLNYDFTGADPHMLESIVPRPGLPPPTAPDDSDPWHGREWDSHGGDLQFSCTFTLPTSKDCTLPQFRNACDCENGATPPLCDTTNKNLQVRGKAYPPVREAALTRALGQQGVLSSICPIHITEAAPNDPLYAYRPAMNALIDRLSANLAK